MLKDKMFKPKNKICLKCEYQFKQKTASRKKNVSTDKKYILWKMDLKFPNLKFNLSCIITYILIYILNVNFAIKYEPFVELSGQWDYFGTNENSSKKLYASVL